MGLFQEQRAQGIVAVQGTEYVEARSADPKRPKAAHEHLDKGEPDYAEPLFRERNLLGSAGRARCLCDLDAWRFGRGDRWKVVGDRRRGADPVSSSKSRLGPPERARTQAVSKYQ